MDVYKKDRLKGIVMALAFIAAVLLQIYGQLNRGYTGLVIQLVSLSILLVLLYVYNRKYR